VAAATGGRHHGPDVVLDGASFDTRSLRPDQLFVPLVAERDGHDFIAAALAAGAPAYLTERAPEGATAIEVADTAAALMDLATWARGVLDVPTVGITGSVGKTSTKDLVAAAVGTARRVTANERSYNNEQGLPVTILDAADDTEVLVAEMGMRGFGQIARLCEVARPTIGVVTAVGHSHTELVGGIEGVAIAKRELVEALPADGVAVLNGDDHRVLAMASAAPGRVVTYGRGAALDVVVEELVLDDLARPSFVVCTPWGSTRVRLAVSGTHMAVNAAAAIAVAGVLGVDPEQAATGLASASVSALRMEVKRTAGGAIVLDDSYNANPTSMVAALDALAAMSARRRVAVLGVMAELDDADAGHRTVAEHAAMLGIELVAVGTDRYGVAPVADPVAVLGQLAEGDAVLVKASRVAALDRVAARLVAG
jgi:UDP-N-acetylmuramoyl-tripeptide--D-alanyl-D-alanine ligase